jgi:hypothetical protein
MGKSAIFKGAIVTGSVVTGSAIIAVFSALLILISTPIENANSTEA